jgi:uncharacterized protein YyaL (SSP411 family)
VIVARDAVTLARRTVPPCPGVTPTTALGDAIGWLCRAHDAAGGRGCARGFSLLDGWLAPYPETTGYIIGTLLEYARRTGDAELRARAARMGDWELEVQTADGGTPMPIGRTGRQYGPPVAFDTGMVLHGFLDLDAAGVGPAYRDGAVRAGNYLVARQSGDGTWRGASSYRGVATTYHARVAWALLRLGLLTGDERFTDAGVRNLDWVVSMQRPNGWFDACAFRPGKLPNTHGIAYTVRGLTEGFACRGAPAYLAAARRTSEVLMAWIETHGTLPAVFDETWNPTVRYSCLTAVAQLAAAWLRLFQLTGEPRWRDTGAKAVDLVVGHQQRLRVPPVVGAVPGSFPIWGRYAPLQFPNWATKFLADALMLRANCLDDAT